MNQMVAHSKGCTHCQVAPYKVTGVGRLYLWFPSPHTLAKIRELFQKTGVDYEEMVGKPGLSIVYEAGQVETVTQSIATVLSIRELQDTQTLLVEGNFQPRIQDFGEITSLQRFIQFNQSDWLLEMLSKERFTSHFQPIVYAKDPRCIYGYEALLRGLDPQGKLVMPGQIFQLAQEAGLLSQVDLAARRSAIRSASQHQIQQRIFINFSPTAIYDPVACLRTTVQAIDAVGIPHENVVFEVVESDQPQDKSHLKTILKYYRDCGFIVALDDFGAGYSSLNLLHQLRPDLIKLDQELIRNVHQDAYKALITEKILEIAQRLEIWTVAEGIECQEEFDWLQRRGATLVQGYWIARPNATPTPSSQLFR